MHSSSVFSFGTSRDRMQKLGVDDVLDRADKHQNMPSPNTYTRTIDFKTKGPKYTMGPKQIKTGRRSDGCDDWHYSRQKNLPGPGYYHQPDLVGTKNSSSTIVAAPSFGFGTARDRFAAPTEKNKAPAPDRYQPQAEIGVDVSSRMPKVPRPKIGNDRTDILDMKFGMKQAATQPGPGQYERYSEFH